MIKKLLRKWFKKWHHNHYCNSHTYKWRQKHINKENPKRNYEKYNYDFVYVKKDCSDKSGIYLLFQKSIQSSAQF